MNIRKLLIGALLIVVTWLGALWLGGAVIQSKVPIDLPHTRLELSSTNNFVIVQGTWIIESERHYTPLHTSKIQCYRPAMECVEATAKIHSDSNFLAVELESFAVSRWNGHELVYSKTYECVDYTYTINFATKSLTGIRAIKLGRPAGCDQKELRLRMTGGLEVTQQLRREAQPWFLKLALFWL